MNEHSQIATWILSAMNATTIPMSEAERALVVIRWLNNIQNGKLVVVEKGPENPPAPADMALPLG